MTKHTHQSPLKPKITVRLAGDFSNAGTTIQITRPPRPAVAGPDYVRNTYPSEFAALEAQVEKLTEDTRVQEILAEAAQKIEAIAQEGQGCASNKKLEATVS